MHRPYLFAFLLGTFLALGIAFFFLLPSTFPVATLTTHTQEISVRVAQTPLARLWVRYGRIFSDVLPTGWLYIYPTAEPRMSPLVHGRILSDVVWFSGETIVTIARNVQDSSSVLVPTDACLVLPAGSADAYGLVEGMRIPRR